jgi:hypothetical protein
VPALTQIPDNLDKTRVNPENQAVGKGSKRPVAADTSVGGSTLPRRSMMKCIIVAAASSPNHQLRPLEVT